MELSTSQRLALEDAHRARVYLLATRRVIGPEIPGYSGDLEMMPPANFLIAHAAELALGAFLRFTGSRGGLLNHDLKARLAAAEAAGLSVTDRFRQYVIAIAPAHKSHEFRYSHEDSNPFIMPRNALSMVEPVIERIATILNERAFGC